MGADRAALDLGVVVVKAYEVLREPPVQHFVGLPRAKPGRGRTKKERKMEKNTRDEAFVPKVRTLLLEGHTRTSSEQRTSKSAERAPGRG